MDESKNVLKEIEVYLKDVVESTILLFVLFQFL